MNAGTIILLLLLLAGPFAMFFMHGRGHGAHAHDSHTAEHGSHTPAHRNRHAGHGCGHSGHGHGGQTDEPIPTREERRTVDVDPPAR